MKIVIDCENKESLTIKVKNFTDEKGVYRNRPICLYNCPKDIEKRIKQAIIEVMCKLVNV